MINKHHIITGFNRGAHTYNQVAALQANIAEKLAIQHLPKTAEKILEIGCGTGLLSQHLVKKFPSADFYLTDIATAMLQQCQNRLPEISRLTLLQMDAEAPPELPQFDLIISSMTFHWFNQLTNTLQRLKQQLKPGCRLCFAMLGFKSLEEWRTMCVDANMPYATPPFPSSDRLKIDFPEIKFHVDVIKESYPSAYIFLQTLKSLGAVASSENYQKASATALRKLLRKLNHEITISYEVVYGEYQLS